MTESEKKANELRKERDLEEATEMLRREQAERSYCVVSFHLQAGRIVRAKTEKTRNFQQG